MVCELMKVVWGEVGVIIEGLVVSILLIWFVDIVVCGSRIVRKVVIIIVIRIWMR